MSYALVDTDLFADPEPEPPRPARHAASCCPGGCLVHVLMPNMAYACYQTMLEVGGHFEFGTSGFDRVTCPDCRAQGVDQIRRRMRWQQGRCRECGGNVVRASCVDCGTAEQPETR